MGSLENCFVQFPETRAGEHQDVSFVSFCNLLPYWLLDVGLRTAECVDRIREVAACGCAKLLRPLLRSSRTRGMLGLHFYLRRLLPRRGKIKLQNALNDARTNSANALSSRHFLEVRSHTSACATAVELEVPCGDGFG